MFVSQIELLQYINDEHLQNCLDYPRITPTA
jgi:hypothetical protein